MGSICKVLAFFAGGAVGVGGAGLVVCVDCPGLDELDEVPVVICGGVVTVAAGLCGRCLTFSRESEGFFKTGVFDLV